MLSRGLVDLKKMVPFVQATGVDIYISTGSDCGSRRLKKNILNFKLVY